MKTIITTLLAALLLTGCMTKPTGETGPDIERIARIAGDATYIGTGIYLKEHPEHWNAFALAEQALTGLVDRQNYDPAAFRDALKGLPFNGFKGSGGELYIMAAIVVWDEVNAATTELNKSEMVKPVLLKVRDGLRLALR